LSGYGGQPGWQDPYQQPGYGPPPAGWQDPYAAGSPGGGFGPPGGGFGYGPPGVPAAPASNGSAVAALVCNIILVLFCNILAIPGIITSGIALGKMRSDPEGSRNLTTWSWVIFGVALVAAVALIVVLVVAGSSGSTTPTTTSPGSV
jgi:hypothetical protein